MARSATVRDMKRLSERRTTSLSPAEAAELDREAAREQRSAANLLRRAWLAYIERKNGGTK